MLIDSPAAGKLGPNRALFFNEQENRIEKFRPYGLPDRDWLERVARQFQSRPRPEPIPVPSHDGDREPSLVEATSEAAEPAEETL
jgi:DNA segregation ATPase FtsK/SpoIIIE, S-DNA-T family